MRDAQREVYVAPDDPLSIILEAVVRLAGSLALVVAIVMAAARNAGTATVLAVVVTTVWLLGVRAAALWSLIAAALATWRFVHRESFRPTRGASARPALANAVVPDALAPGGAALRSRGPAPRCVDHRPVGVRTSSRDYCGSSSTAPAWTVCCSTSGGHDTR